jgi:hypothetical protein
MTAPSLPPDLQLPRIRMAVLDKSKPGMLATAILAGQLDEQVHLSVQIVAAAAQEAARRPAGRPAAR